MSSFQRNPFFLPLLAVLSGMVAEAALPGNPWSYWPALALVPMAILALLLLSREVLLARVPWALGICCFFGGGLWLSLHPLPVAPLSNAEAGERVVAVGCVDSNVNGTPERIQFVLRTPEAARLQVSLYPREGERLPAIQYGQAIEVQGRIRPPRNFRNPGAFDYERFLARQNIHWLLTATGVENLTSPQAMRDPDSSACGHPIVRYANKIRHALLQRLSQHYAAQPEARAWLSAMLLGDDSSLAEQTLESYRVAGVYHVLVISGQHIAIIAAACLLLVRLLPIPRWFGFLLTALVCWTYTMVAGYEVPAIRAACAVTLYLAGSLMFRHARPLNLLSLIALLFLAWDPGQLLDASFQLSFLAVLAIAGIASPLQRRWFGGWPPAAIQLGDTGRDLRLPPTVAQARVELRLIVQTLHLATRIPERVCTLAVTMAALILSTVGSLLLISVIVQAVLTPLLVHDFHRAALVAPLTNLLLSPILGAVIPLAFLDLLLPVPGLGHGLSMVVGFTNAVVDAIARHVPDLHVPDVPPLLLVLAWAAVVASILAWESCARPLSARERREVILAGAGSRGHTRGRWSAALAGGACLLLAAVLLHPFPPEIQPGEWEIAMLDVGQGDSTLVIAPGGATTLIDTGGLGAYSSSARLDTGEDVVAPYLWRRGIRRIDTLVLSHFDYDHAGGAPAILRIFRPLSLWLSEIPRDHALWPSVELAARNAGTRIEVLRQGDHGEFGGLSWRVLHPATLQPASGGDASHSNDTSLVLHLRFGETSALFTGDIHQSAEYEMLGREVLPEVDVLKVPHHGSRTSSGEPFLDAASPAVALISAGFLNPYRHPSQVVVDRLFDRGAAVFRTDRDGAIILRSDGRRWHHTAAE